MSDARDYSISKVPYLEREEEITDQPHGFLILTHRESQTQGYHARNAKPLRANAQKNRANRGHSSKPNQPSFSVCNKVLMSL